MYKSQHEMTLPLDSTQFLAACDNWVAEHPAIAWLHGCQGRFIVHCFFRTSLNCGIRWRLRNARGAASCSYKQGNEHGKSDQHHRQAKRILYRQVVGLPLHQSGDELQRSYSSYVYTSATD